MYSLFIFSYLYLNSKIEYRKNDSFLHVRVFCKLFWIHNLDIKFIIYGLALFSIIFFTYTLSHQLGGVPCVFTIFIKLTLYSFSMKMKMLNRCFHFLYSNLTFKILKTKFKYKFLNQTSVFCGGSHWKLKMKTKKHNFFWLTKQALNISKKITI